MPTSILESVKNGFVDSSENSEVTFEVLEKIEAAKTTTPALDESTDVSFVIANQNLHNEENDKEEIILEIPEEPKEESISIQTVTEIDLKKVLCPVQTPHNEGSVKDTVDTGFDREGSLTYKPCSSQVYSEPLYKENFLSEFETDDEKRQARHNLGLYDQDDVVAMSLLTSGDAVTDDSILDELQIKTLLVGASPVAVLTTASAVFVKLTSGYSTLLDILGDYDTLILNANTKVEQLINKSTDGSAITTVGDINTFLSGFTNSETLVGVLGDYLKFESKGTIEQKAWQI